MERGNFKRQQKHKNLFCIKCDIPMIKRGKIKEGEPRYKCKKCGEMR